MKKIIVRILRSCAGRINILANKISDLGAVPFSTTPYAMWVEAGGDKTLRVDYLLSSESIVLDVGGYEGQWASDIFARYLCQIHIFEPVPKFASMIEKRFLHNDHIHLYRIGLGGASGEMEFTVDGDASSSIVRGEQKTIKAPVVAFNAWVEENGVQDIALMKINIEGGEYALLEHMIETGLISRIKNIQVQFHDFFPDAERRMDEIKKRLERTHRPTYQYQFIWENWTLKDAVR